MIDEPAVRARYAAIKDQLEERARRLFVAAEKIVAGYGGTAAVSRATGVAHSTIDTLSGRAMQLAHRSVRHRTG